MYRIEVLARDDLLLLTADPRFQHLKTAAGDNRGSFDPAPALSEGMQKVCKKYIIIDITPILANCCRYGSYTSGLLLHVNLKQGQRT